MHESLLDLNLTLLHEVYEPALFSCSLQSSLARADHCQYPGIASELTRMVMQRMQLPIVLQSTMFPSTLNLVSQNPNACTIPTYAESTQRKLEFKLSDAVYRSTSTFAYYKPETDVGQYFNFIFIFEPQTWIVFGVLLFFFKSFSELYDLHVMSSASQPIGRQAKNCLTSCSFFVALTLSMYNSGLLSKLLMSRQRPLFTDLDGLTVLVRQGQVKLLFVLHDASHDKFRELRQLDGLRQAAEHSNGMVIVQTEAEAWPLLFSESCRYVFLSNLFRVLTLAIDHQGIKDVPMQEMPSGNLVMMCNQNMSEFFVENVNRILQEKRSFGEGLLIRYERWLRWRSIQELVRKTQKRGILDT